MTIEAELEVMQPQAMDHLEPPEVDSGIFPRTSEGAQPCQHWISDFWPREL